MNLMKKTLKLITIYLFLNTSISAVAGDACDRIPFECPGFFCYGLQLICESEQEREFEYHKERERQNRVLQEIERKEYKNRNEYEKPRANSNYVRPIEKPIEKPDEKPHTSYFTIVSQSIVKDSRTGLEWMRCSLGQEWSNGANTCTGQVKTNTWQAAQDYVKELNATGGYDGKTGWRIPTIRELQSIPYCSKGFSVSTKDLQDGQKAVPSSCNDGSSKPTIDVTTFPATQDIFYWSSTPYLGDSYAWVVSFDDGHIGYDYRNGDYAVRLVR